MSEKAEAFKNIVVAYDGTSASRRALEHAADLAEAVGGKLCVVSVVPVVYYGIRGGPIEPGESKERHDEELAEARAVLGSRNVEAEFVEAVGDPGDSIVDVAEAKGASLIVVGSRVLSMLERLLDQSVSSYIHQHTRCDVLCVH